MAATSLDDEKFVRDKTNANVNRDSAPACGFCVDCCAHTFINLKKNFSIGRISLHFTMEATSIPDKIFKFESFVNDVLKEDLKRLENRLTEVNSEIAEYVELKNMIHTIEEADVGPDGFKTKVDIGCNFYMQANVPDPSKLFVDIGLGNYVELQSGEALKFCEMRIELLSKKGKLIQSECAKTKGHIKLVLHGISELSKFPQVLTK
ncbi:protein UXT homolog [Thrips palmi]|uniref:Protein UXT homolog n=1 Tax=Thrips palmi TaxID=161013 RepID=A0A6P8Y899_THRPL|nr:protein UXT homolog [Thrips palmi]